MGWAYGVDEYGEEVGYGVEPFCAAVGCDAPINKGLAYRCGGINRWQDLAGCGAYFCGEHLLYGHGSQVCEACWGREVNAWTK